MSTTSWACARESNSHKKPRAISYCGVQTQNRPFPYRNVRVCVCSADLVGVVARIHLQRGFDVGLPVLASALRRRLLSLRHDSAYRAIERRTQREPEVVGEEDGHLLELVFGEFLVEQCCVDLD